MLEALGEDIEALYRLEDEVWDRLVFGCRWLSGFLLIWQGGVAVGHDLIIEISEVSDARSPCVPSEVIEKFLSDRITLSAISSKFGERRKLSKMAYFYSIRGWLEVEPDNFSKIIEVVQSLQSSYPKDTKQGLYLQGWCWRETPINWTH